MWFWRYVPRLAIAFLEGLEISIFPPNCADLIRYFEEKKEMISIISMEDIDKRIQGALAIRVSVFGVENTEGEALPFGTQYLGFLDGT